MAGRWPRPAWPRRRWPTRWSLWAANEIERTLLLAAANLFLFAPEDRRADEAAMALAKLDRPWRVLDAHLADTPFLVGGRLTVADVNVCGLMSLVPFAGIDVSGYPHMAAWLTTNLERPAAADWKPIHFVVPRPPEGRVMMMFV